MLHKKKTALKEKSYKCNRKLKDCLKKTRLFIEYARKSFLQVQCDLIKIVYSFPVLHSLRETYSKLVIVLKCRDVTS